jgi:hypothetical protein
MMDLGSVTEVGMGKVFGILLVVVGLWAGAEIYTKGTANAFGGIFASGDGAAAEAAEAQPMSRRSGAKVAGAHADADARRNRLLEE